MLKLIKKKCLQAAENSLQVIERLAGCQNRQMGGMRVTKSDLKVVTEEIRKKTKLREHAQKKYRTL